MNISINVIVVEVNSIRDPLTERQSFDIMVFKDVKMSDNKDENIKEILHEISEKLKVVLEISSILRNTNSEIVKTDKNVQLLLEKVEGFEKNFLNRVLKIAAIMEEHENRLKRLENIYHNVSFSRN